MPALVELAASIVSTHCSMTELTTDELLRELQLVYRALNDLQSGNQAEDTETMEEKITPKPISLKKAFQAEQVICMICGRGGMKTLSRHLSRSHAMKPSEYRKQFGIPRSQPLTARSLSESRRQMANDRGLAETLAKARETRSAKPRKKAGARSGSKGKGRKVAD